MPRKTKPQPIALVPLPAGVLALFDKEPKTAHESNATVYTDEGPLRIELPREREASFEPIPIPKHKRRFTGFDDKIIAMYARGMTVRLRPCTRRCSLMPCGSKSAGGARQGGLLGVGRSL